MVPSFSGSCKEIMSALNKKYLKPGKLNKNLRKKINKKQIARIIRNKININMFTFKYIK